MRLFYCTRLREARCPLRLTLGPCDGFAPLDLGAAAPFGQIISGFLPGRVAGLNVVDHVGGACRMGQPGRRALVLQDVGVSRKGRVSSLNVHLKLVFGDFRGGETRANGLFELCIGLRRGSGGLMGCRHGCLLSRGSRFGSRLAHASARQCGDENEIEK